jgi:uracil-DNA glycosylase family 4
MTKQEQLNLLQGESEFCNSCSLCGVKVWDNGSCDAEVMIIAEAPGADEEKEGLPLIGRCGKLIEQMLNEIGLSRENTWRANCLVCRPPNNRDPEQDEIKACSYFLYKQIDIIKPRIIVALGRFSAQTLLDTKESISSLAGKWYISDESESKLFVTYHPSYILRGNCMESFKEHFQMIKEELNNE